MSEIPGTADISAAEDPAIPARIRGWNRFYKVAVIWAAGWVGLILEKIVKLESVVDGVREGAIGGAFVSPFLLIITLPLGLLGSRIGSWEKWRRYRIWFTFGLPALYILMGVAGALHGRYFPQARFKRITGWSFRGRPRWSGAWTTMAWFPFTSGPTSMNSAVLPGKPSG